jgi:hypothetical protein
MTHAAPPAQVPPNPEFTCLQICLEEMYPPVESLRPPAKGGATAAKTPSAARTPRRVLRAMLAAVQTELKAEQLTRADAEAQAAAALVTAMLMAAEVRQTREQLVSTQDLADSLAVVNRGLEEELEAVKSELPAKDIAYAQLKAQFFKLQSRLLAAQAAAAGAAAR